MHIGHTLVASADSSTDYFTPWFPASADNGIFTYEKIHGNMSLTVTVYHKDMEDPGSAPGSPATSTFTQIGSTTFYEAKCEGLKELVRFKLQVSSGGGESGAYFVYRFLPPVWYSTAKA